VDVLSLFSARWWPVDDEFHASKWAECTGVAAAGIELFGGGIFVPDPSLVRPAQ
jgi:hypothetical protein